MGLLQLEWEGNFTEVQLAFLKKLGVKEHPCLMDILNLLAAPEQKISRSKTLQYFLDHFETEYKKEYKKLKAADIPAFVPTRRETLERPSNCYMLDLDTLYSKDEAEILRNYLNYSEISPEIASHAKKLGIEEVVPPEKLMRLLEEQPPTKEQAEYGQYLSYDILFMLICDIDSFS